MASSLEFLAPTADVTTLHSEKNSQKIGFLHLGCPKNLVDTENMLGLLEKEGHVIVADESEADLVLVNTCAFIDKAQQESVRCLANLAEQGKRLIISGCLAQKFQGELLELFPEAEAVVGIGNVPEIADIVSRTTRGERVLAVQQDPTYLLEEDTVRKHITVGASVYVKIAEGCDYRCTFCIIPSMRGDFRSRSVQNIVDNVKELVTKGVSEVVLVGQDTTSYGKDIGSTLADLLEALNEIEGLQWIRFLYAYPSQVTQRLLDVMNTCDKVVKYMDCPLQHSHPAILKRMNRPEMDIAAFAAWVRASVKNVKLRTSFIVGFPGETEAHFQHLQNTIQAVKWDRLGVFEYSDVDSAPSQKLDGKVPAATIRSRRKQLMEIQQKIAYELNLQQVNQVVPVLIDSISPSGLLVGRTQWDAPEIDNTVSVRISAKSKELAYPGEIVHVQITGATPYDLKGKLVEATSINPLNEGVLDKADKKAAVLA